MLNTLSFKKSLIVEEFQGNSRLLPNGRPVAWGALVASVGDQSFVQGARTGAYLYHKGN